MKYHFVNAATKISRLWLILLLFPVVLPAQDWQNICSPGVSFFKNCQGDVGATYRDSIVDMENGDTLLFSYPTIQPAINSKDCLDTLHGSVLGKKMIKKADGRIFLFTRNNDTLVVYSQAPLTTGNKFCSLPNNGYINATTSFIELEEFLNVTDSVRTYTLQAKDSLNNNITHPLNQTTIKLSKNHGFIKIPDVNLLLNDTSFYYLIGKESPQIGQQNISWIDIYDFDVGDEFHYYGSHDTMYSGGSYWYVIKKILEKTMYDFNDSVTYLIEYCKREVTYSNPQLTNIHDTITKTYSFISLSQDTAAGIMPHHFYPVDTLASEYYTQIDLYPGRLSKGVERDNYITYGNGCWQSYSSDTAFMYEYTAGLGETFFYSIGGFYWAEIWEERLVYFKKGTETWGTPVSTDCTTLVPVDVIPAPETEISIYPVPVSTNITIETPYQGQLTIQNLQGQEVIHHQITKPKTRFDISTLPSGVYLVKVTGERAVKVGKFVKQ